MHGLVSGLIIGEKKNIEETTIQDFKNSNLSHMLAISGAHVSYFILGITFLLEKSKVSKRATKAALICFLLFFMALVEFTPSVTRACIMAILQLLASLFFRKADVYNSLAIASILIIIANPYSILDIGFQLSFGGTIGILFFYQPILQYYRKIRGLIKWVTRYCFQVPSQLNSALQTISCSIIIKKLFNYVSQTIFVTLAANLSIFPLMMYHFNNFSLVFLLSNLLASPILAISIMLSFMVICLSFFCFPLAKLLSYLLVPILQLLINIAKFTGNLPFANLLVPTPNIISIIYYYSFLLFFLKRHLLKGNIRKNLFYLFIIFMLILILTPLMLSIIPSSNLKIFMIDVGQGDSMLIQTPHHQTILIDGGGSEFGNFDVGERTLLPYLLDKKITTIDYMLFSHFDRRPLFRITDSSRKNKS